MKQYFFLVFLLTFFMNSISQTPDSLYNIVRSNQPDSLKALANVELANLYFGKNNDSARYFCHKAIEHYQIAGLVSEQAYPLKMAAITYAMQGQQDSAILFTQKAFEIYALLNDSLNMAFTLNNVGLMYSDFGDYEKSVSYLINSLEIKMALADNFTEQKLDIASTMINTGIAFHFTQEYDKAENYYNQAKEYADKKENIKALHLSLFQLANLYFDIERFDESALLYEKIIQEEYFEGNDFAQAKINNNYGNLLFEKGEFEAAEIHLTKAYELNKKIGNMQSMVKNLNNLASLAYKKSDLQETILKAEEARQIGHENNFTYSEKISADILCEAYEETGNYKQSVKYHKISRQLQDTLFNVSIQEKMAELDTKYQTAEKEKQIALALFFVVFAFRKVRKQKILLDNKNAELELLNDSLNKMFAIISHDLRNLISGFKGSGDLVTFYLENNETDKLRNMAGHLSENADRLDVLLNNLLNWAISQGGVYNPKIESQNVKKTIDGLIALNQNIALKKQIKIENKIDEYSEVLADGNNLSFIFRNLISNALKFTEKGKITFSSEKLKNKTQIRITDTGIGIPKEKLEIIFKLKTDKKSLGTAGEKGTGLGLKLVYDFVTLNAGNIKFESEPGKGTSVIVELPNS